jgi:dienelactone hydrolase
MKPGSWFNAIFFKPFYVIRAMIQAVPWIIRNRPAATKPGVFKFMTALRTFPPPFPTNDLKIGAAGFCWGGYFTIQLAHNTPSARVIRHESQLNSSTIQPLIDCGYTAHPSNVKVPSDIEPVELPLSVIVGDIDIQMKGPLGVKTKEILEGKSKDNEVVIIPGAKQFVSPQPRTCLRLVKYCYENIMPLLARRTASK